MNLGNKNLADAMKRLAAERGEKVEIITATIDEKMDRAVSDFIEKIEQAHRDAAYSKLNFRSYCMQSFYYS